MDADKVTVTRITEEEAQAFRDRVKKKNEELAKWVVIPVDELLELLESLGCEV